MRIRLMTAEDVPAVAAIEKACFSEPWSEQGFLDGMNNSAIFLVRMKNRLPVISVCM